MDKYSNPAPLLILDRIPVINNENTFVYEPSFSNSNSDKYLLALPLSLSLGQLNGSLKFDGVGKRSIPAGRKTSVQKLVARDKRRANEPACSRQVPCSGAQCPVKRLNGINRGDASSRFRFSPLSPFPSRKRSGPLMPPDCSNAPATFAHPSSASRFMARSFQIWRVCLPFGIQVSLLVSFLENDRFYIFIINRLWCCMINKDKSRKNIP